MNLDRFRGKHVMVVVRNNHITGFISGILKHYPEVPIQGDYLVEGTGSRLLFNVSVIDHVNDFDPFSPIIFLTAKDNNES